jgi:phytoene dehydrogenase-like protein
MSDVPLPEPSLEIGGKLLPYERRHFHTPGMAAKLGYTEGLQQYWNAGAVHAHAAAVSAAENARLREALHEIAEEWAGAECGEPVHAQEAYAIGLARRMYALASQALRGASHE